MNLLCLLCTHFNRIFFVALAMLLITGMVLIVLGCALFSYVLSFFRSVIYFL